MYRKLILTSLLCILILCLSVPGMATRNTGNPFFKTIDGYVTSDFTKRDPLLEPIVAPAPKSEPIVAAEPAPQPVVIPAPGAKSGRYYRYDSRLPDAGKIEAGGHVINP